MERRPEAGRSRASIGAREDSGALFDSEERFRLLVEAVRDYAILSLDVSGHVTSWNTGAEYIKGYAAEEILGKHFSTFYPPEDAEAGKPDRQLVIAAAEGRFEAEGWRVRKDGSRFWANVVITALYDEDRQLRGFGKVTRDITERVAAEHESRKAAADLAVANAVLRRQAAELSLARDAAERALVDAQAGSHAKSVFLATMSHELRTPMNGLVGMAELLLHTQLTTEQREYARTMESCAQGLLAVIAGVLDYSRIESGRIDIDIVDFAPGGVIEECVNLFGVNAQAKGLELVVEIDAASPACVRGDVSRVRQVLLQLLDNAIKFTRRGQITVGVCATPDGDARIEVIDSGIGIAPEDCAGLFAPFAQLDGSSTREHGGSGLGLAISKQLVELMGGEVGVDSTAGIGSTFWFTLKGADHLRPQAPLPRGRRWAGAQPPSSIGATSLSFP